MIIAVHVSQKLVMKLHRCLSHWEICGRKYRCFDFETYGATINAAWAFCLLSLPVKSQSMRQEVGARQYQPMISWERKWAALNVPKTQFMKSFWTACGNKRRGIYVLSSDTDFHICEHQEENAARCCLVSVVLSGIPVIDFTPHTVHTGTNNTNYLP